MFFDQILTSFIYLAALLSLLVLGKWAYALAHRSIRISEELVDKDNTAFALTLAGYFLGLVFALGGVIQGPSHGLVEDLFDIYFFGIAAILLQLVSGWVSDRLILYKFDSHKELFLDQNAGTGAVEAGNHIAVGLIIGGALSGEGGSLVTALVFWALGQLALVISMQIYNFLLNYDVHQQIERDNVAVGVAFSGLLVALGNIIRAGVAGDFIGWAENLSRFGLFLAVGLVALPLLRVAVDRIFMAHRSLSDELARQEKPNLGAGLLEASSYLLASLMVVWAF